MMGRAGSAQQLNARWRLAPKYGKGMRRALTCRLSLKALSATKALLRYMSQSVWGTIYTIFLNVGRLVCNAINCAPAAHSGKAAALLLPSGRRCLSPRSTCALS